MKKVSLAALLVLTLSAGAAQAQESPATRLDTSWLANYWEALTNFVETIFPAEDNPAPPPTSTGADTDCGAGIDPTGGCKG